MNHQPKNPMPSFSRYGQARAVDGCNFSNNYYGDQLCAQDTEVLRASSGEATDSLLIGYPAYTITLLGVLVVGLLGAVSLFAG